ncbi:serine/threonine-protein kinase 33 isoform X1 [Leptinotarsa decemlineata]|uniref:serine/threonine-protein kinase 33 isoform X1 n=1 Tax=Leptinotarsa decemlineata TaxID=7539 RepID=UPI000C25378A|nr:serine/threonine-protein kinase 33-like isoform X2 [Leptinotarsa decemlineata]
MIGEERSSPLYLRSASLKEREIKHFRIDDVKKLYEVFEFQEEIGHGAFGTVVAAVEKSTSTQYAIKIVNKFSAGTAQMDEIKREIKILKSVSHQNIIRLDKIYESAKKIYMVMERCRDTLFNKYRSENPFTEKISKKIIKQLVDAVHYLHKHDIVHRDIKMENILLTKNVNDPFDNFFIKLSDFGLSVIKSGTGISGLLRDRVGTVIYMAPEILSGHTYSELCDVWSVGVILYLLIFNKFPFIARNQDDLVVKICEEEPEYPKETNNDRIDLLKSILVKDPVKRVTALEILKHPWMVDNKIKSRKDETIIDYMKKWKSEMRLPGEESDWVSAILDVEEIDMTSRPSLLKAGADDDDLSQVSTGMFSQYSAFSTVSSYYQSKEPSK